MTGEEDIMLNLEDQKKLQDMIRNNWLIFYAFTGSIVLYTVVMLAITGIGSGKPLEVDGILGILFNALSNVETGGLRLIFIAVSVLLGAIKFLIQNMLWLKEDAYRSCQALDEIVGRYGRYYFIILALCQVVPPLGMIIVLMTNQMKDWWPFFGITVMLFATSIPQGGKLESIVQTHATNIP
jgi:hypothetical protein